MSGIVNKVLDISDPAGFFEGLSGKTAAKGTAAALEFQREAAELERQQRERAREDVMSLFPSAIESAQQGFQSALDVFGQSIPIQANTFQQGNVGAQQVLSQGLPQFQNAILGLPTDLSFTQPQQLTMPDLAFLKQQLPQLNQEQVAQPEVSTPNQSFTGPFGTSFNFGQPSNQLGLTGNLNALELLANRRV